MIVIHATLCILIGILPVLYAKDEVREIVCTEQRTFRLTSEIDLSPKGRNYFVFAIKSCDAAILALSNIRNIRKNRGRYFFLYLGRNHNTHISLLDSCFGCTPKVVVRQSALDCYSYRLYWIQWDNNASVTVGAGRVVGQNTILTYTSTKPFLVNFAQVTTLAASAIWRFITEESKFHSPKPDGSTVIQLREDTVIGEHIHRVHTIPEASVVMTTKYTPCKCARGWLKLSSPLDYESEKIHFIKFRIAQQNTTAILTIVVVDVNDEIPQIDISPSFQIPEELPVGFIFQGIFKVTDRDARDNLRSWLEGKDSGFFEILPSHHVRVARRIDRDGGHGHHVLTGLVLVVEDAVLHRSTRAISVVIMDIDDRLPTCSPVFSSVLVTDDMSASLSSNPIAEIQCDERDTDPPVSLSVVQDSDASLFGFFGKQLYADLDSLRLQNTFSDNGQNFSLFILLTEFVPLTYTQRVKIVVHTQRNVPQHTKESTLEWQIPLLSKEGKFPDIFVQENAPLGTVLQVFRARGSTPDITYRILPASPGNGTKFVIEESTGRLRVIDVLDSDADTDGEKEHYINVSATMQNRVIHGVLRINVRNVNDNSPSFNSTMNVVSMQDFKNASLTILKLLVWDNDGDDASVWLSQYDKQFFIIDRSNMTVTLKFHSSISPLNDWRIPSSIKIHGTDNGVPTRHGYATVVLLDLPCRAHHQWVSYNIRHSPVLSHRERRDVQSHRRTVSTETECYTNTVDEEVEDAWLYLILLCFVEGTAIIFLLYFISVTIVRCCLRRRYQKGTPSRQSQNHYTGKRMQEPRKVITTRSIATNHRTSTRIHTQCRLAKCEEKNTITDENMLSGSNCKKIVYNVCAMDRSQNTSPCNVHPFQVTDKQTISNDSVHLVQNSCHLDSAESLKTEKGCSDEISSTCEILSSKTLRVENFSNECTPMPVDNSTQTQFNKEYDINQTITKSTFLDIVFLSQKKSPTFEKTCSDSCPDRNEGSKSMRVTILPVEGVIKMKKEFFTGLVYGIKSSFAEGMFEVDKRQLKDILTEHGGDVARLESASRVFPVGRSKQIHVIFMPRSVLFEMLSRLDNHQSLEYKRPQIIEIKEEVFITMTSSAENVTFKPLAVLVGYGSGIILFNKCMFLDMLYFLNIDVVHVAEEVKNKLNVNQQIVETFWSENIIGITLGTKSVYLLASVFLEVMLSERKVVDENEVVCHDILAVSFTHLSKLYGETMEMVSSNAFVMNCIGVCPLSGLLYMFRERFETISGLSLSAGSDQSELICVPENTISQMCQDHSVDKSCDKIYILNMYALAFNEGRSTYYFTNGAYEQFVSDVTNQTLTICNDSSSSEDNDDEEEEQQQYCYSYKETTVTVKSHSVINMSAFAHEKYQPWVNAKKTTKRKVLKRFPTKTKKMRIKPWKKEVRMRLYPKTNKEKKDSAKP